MAKILAMLIAFCMLTGMGLRKANRLRDRARLLDALRRGIRSIALSMEYEQRPAGSIASGIRLTEAEPLFSAFGDALTCGGSAKAAWDSAFLRAKDENARYRSLTGEDCRVLHAYFASLGTGDLRTEKRRAEETLRRLDALSELAAQETAQKSRAYGTVGLLCGAAAVLLML